MWGQSRKHTLVKRKDMWAAEKALSDSERRARYRCGNRYATLDDIPQWTETVAELQQRNAAKRKAYDDHLALLEKEKQEKEKEAEAEREKAEKEKEGEKKEKEGEGEAKTEKDGEVVAAAAGEKKEEEAVEVKKKKSNAPPPFAPRIEAPSEQKPPLFAPDAELNNIISLWRGDITTMEIDGVVNAANQSLLGGGGIDGAIHRAAGDNLYYECKQLNGCLTGGCKISRGYNLPAKYILHTVGPVGEYPKSLVACYRNCLRLAVKFGIRSIAFCGISTGIYGYPLYAASHIAVRTIRQWLDQGDNRKHFDRIIFCVFLAKELDCYQELLPLYFPAEGTPFTPTGLADEDMPEYMSDDSDTEDYDAQVLPSNDADGELVQQATGVAGNIVAEALEKSEAKAQEEVTQGVAGVAQATAQSTSSDIALAGILQGGTAAAVLDLVAVAKDTSAQGYDDDEGEDDAPASGTTATAPEQPAAGQPGPVSD